MSKNYLGGLNFTGPSKGDTNWDTIMDAVLNAVSGHAHTGNGDGTIVGFGGSGTVDANGIPEMPLGLRLYGGPGTDITNAPLLTFGNTTPSSGTYRQGDILLNSAPASSTDVIGWRCIVAGAPGTWSAITTSPVIGADAGGTISTSQNGGAFSSSAGSLASWSLPTAALGLRFFFVNCASSSTTQAHASGSDVVQFGASLSSAGGYIQNASNGGAFTLVGTNVGRWVVASHEGTCTLA